jgi:hypothetical protein
MPDARRDKEPIQFWLGIATIVLMIGTIAWVLASSMLSPLP